MNALMDQPGHPYATKVFQKGAVPTLYLLAKTAINPFSNYIFCVSCLTASCHMRHPQKADLGENEDEFCVCV